MLKYKYEVISQKNTKYFDKPNEDYVIYNENDNIGLILDGVSRDRENGHYPNPSPASRANYIFSEKIMSEYTNIKKKGIKKIYDLICKANDELKKYNHYLKHHFPAGTVGIVFDLEDKYFNYGYIGDCYAVLIRDNSRRIFTECQTDMISKHKSEYSTDEIRFNICNNINHPYGYGVWDGNNNAMDFVKCDSVKLKNGDVILMYTDGLNWEVNNKSIYELKEYSLNELFLNNQEGLDDRSCIRITVNE